MTESNCRPLEGLSSHSISPNLDISSWLFPWTTSSVWACVAASGPIQRWRYLARYCPPVSVQQELCVSSNRCHVQGEHVDCIWQRRIHGMKEGVEMIFWWRNEIWCWIAEERYFTLTVVTGAPPRWNFPVSIVNNSLVNCVYFFVYPLESSR